MHLNQQFVNKGNRPFTWEWDKMKAAASFVLFIGQTKAGNSHNTPPNAPGSLRNQPKAENGSKLDRRNSDNQSENLIHLDPREM